MLSYPSPSPRRADRSAKNFQPALNASDQAARWLRVLAADLASRVNEDEDHRLPRTITIHHRHGGSTKSRQAPLPTVKEMGKEFLYTHALSVWRGIEAEGRAFPANNISVAVSGFGDVEDGVQGIQGFLVPGVQTSHTSKLEVKRESTVEMSGKRKRDDDGIAKFLMKKEETTPPPQEQVMQEVEDVLGKRNWEDDGIAKILMKKEESTPPLVPLKDEIEEHDEMETGDTYVCSKCHKHFPLQEMEEHEDYHVALELSKGSPIRAPSLSQAKTKAISKEEKKGPKKKIKPVEKGQRRLDFGM